MKVRERKREGGRERERERMQRAETVASSSAMVKGWQDSLESMIAHARTESRDDDTRPR